MFVVVVYLHFDDKMNFGLILVEQIYVQQKRVVSNLSVSFLSLE